ncbi:MAG: AbrB/MazE/SpoVT family DNA-binding domain-containing protein [Deltaproteobacteria bacterium]|nr:AbrB/MazE/SpoVT family DNA-binding domain-containing protein [Deltaproteobacteria bacterium]
MLSPERIQIPKNGRFVIPAAYRRALGLEGGGEVVLRLRQGCLELEPAALALQRAREAVHKYARGRDLVAELLDERREEAAHD